MCLCVCKCVTGHGPATCENQGSLRANAKCCPEGGSEGGMTRHFVRDELPGLCNLLFYIFYPADVWWLTFYSVVFPLKCTYRQPGWPNSGHSAQCWNQGQAAMMRCI